MSATTSVNAERDGPRLPPRVHHAPKPDRRRGHQTSVRERQAIVAVAAVAASVGAFSTASPTSFTVTDIVLRAAVAGLISLATSRARRWTWLVLAGLSVVGAPAGFWFAVCAAGLVFAFVTTLFSRRRIYGAIVGACAAQGLLRFTDVAAGRASVVLFLVAVTPVFVSAYLVSPQRVRRRVHLGLAAVGVVALVATLAFGVAALLAFNKVQSAERQARSGLAAVRDGHSDDAVADLREASASFAAANDLVDAWWAKPAGGVPFVAQQAKAVQVVTAEGAAMTATASRTAAQADIQKLKYDNGQIDVALLATLATPLHDTATSFAHAGQAIEQVRSPWLVPPLASGIDDLQDELDRALPELQLADQAATAGPALLGAHGTRHYLVLFTQPAESRGLGGFVGNWAELTATDGRLELARSGRTNDLNATPGRDTRTVTSPPAPEDYVARYGRFRPGYFFQDITLSPDLPAVAAAARQLYPTMGGEPIDGVLTVDPYALAALLQFTGPIRVDGYDQALTAENAAELLVRDQYVKLGTNETREDFLDQASRKTFEALVHGSLPSPKRVGEVLGPMVSQRRLLFTSFDDTATGMLHDVGLDGAFPTTGGGDFFEVVTQNNANNKIDLYLHRSIDYDTKYNPGTGEIESTMTVTLRNDAPASGLPPSVIGSNDQGLPPGTNRLYVSVYTPLGLRSARDATHAIAVEFQHELGYSVYSEYVDIPPGGTATLALDLFGQIEPGATHRLRVGTQPTVNRDQVSVHVRAAGDWELTGSPDLDVDASRSSATGALQPANTVDLRTELARP